MVMLYAEVVKVHMLPALVGQVHITVVVLGRFNAVQCKRDIAVVCLHHPSEGARLRHVPEPLVKNVHRQVRLGTTAAGIGCIGGGAAADWIVNCVSLLETAVPSSVVMIFTTVLPLMAFTREFTTAAVRLSPTLLLTVFFFRNTLLKRRSCRLSSPSARHWDPPWRQPGCPTG